VVRGSLIMDEKILKADSVSDKVVIPSPKVLKREVYEATREASDVVALAQEKARQIIEEALREQDSIRERARQEGNAQGLAEWNRVLTAANQRADELTKSWEETMLRLSVRVAEKIIGEQLRVHPETIVEIIREVMKNIRPGKRLTIQVNQADAQRARARIDRIKDGLSTSSEIEIVASGSVSPGGCLIESELGIIDARLETQLKCLEEALVRGSGSSRD
jgi:type III secretion protein L